MSDNICPVCESGKLVERTNLENFQRGTRALEYLRHFSVCDACDVEMTTPEQHRLNRKAIVLAEGESVGAPRPEEVLHWRTMWGLTQQAAGEMLRVGPTAFSKYENAKLVPSGPTCSLLHLIIHSQSATETLAAQRGITLHLNAALVDGGHVVELLPNQVLFADPVVCAGKLFAVVRNVRTDKMNVVRETSEEFNGAQAARV